MQNPFLLRAIQLARANVSNRTGGPFGAVVVKDGVIIGEGANHVTTLNDPTAHAEIVAIRTACRYLDSFELSGCEIYSSCEPCPMCLAAIYWSRASKIYFAASREDAASAGFDDEFLYRELARPFADRSLPIERLPCEEANQLFEDWGNDLGKIRY